MKDRTKSGGVQSELWFRSTASQGGSASRSGALETLQRLERVAEIDRVQLRSWPKGISRSPPVVWTEEGRAVLERYDEIEAWATERGVSLAPFFETKRTCCTFTGDEDTVVHLPTIALVEYRDDRIRHVAPHSTGDVTITVADRLDALLNEGSEEATPTGVAQPAGGTNG